MITVRLVLDINRQFAFVTLILRNSVVFFMLKLI